MFLHFSWPHNLQFTKLYHYYYLLLLVEIAKFIGRKLGFKLFFHHLLFIETATYVFLVLTPFLKGIENISFWTMWTGQCLSVWFLLLVHHFPSFLLPFLKLMTSQTMSPALISLQRANLDFKIPAGISVWMETNTLNILSPRYNR